MKLGIIGSGMIVKDFLSFAHEIPEIKLEAITARNIENLKELQNKYNIKEIYTDIDLLLLLLKLILCLQLFQTILQLHHTLT